MCSRVSQVAEPARLAVQLGLELGIEAQAPEPRGRPGEAYVVARRGRGGKPELATARWGLVPAWSNDGRFKAINARAETAAVKMSFRGAFLERPAALPVTGWFEWLRNGSGRTLYRIEDWDNELLWLAGLWQPAHEGSAVDTFTVITTEPRPDLAAIHDRQPAIIEPGKLRAWLTADRQTRQRLMAGQGNGRLRITREPATPVAAAETGPR